MVFIAILAKVSILWWIFSLDKESQVQKEKEYAKLYKRE
jgi:hypothetical protein